MSFRERLPSNIISKLANYILQDKIGSGSFGKVYRVREKQTKKIYAAKITKIDLNEETYELFIDISREANIMSKLNHPSVLKFILYSPINFKNKAKPVIITEYAKNGSLMDFIAHDRSFPDNPILNETHKLIIIYGIAAAMSYLHSNNIIHRDLKPDNILLDEFFLPKVADFGLSKSCSKESQESVLKQTMSGTIKGTPKYMSPEIWLNAEYSEASDVYAFAITVYEIIVSEKPFQDMDIYRIMMMVRSSKRPELTEEVPNAYRKLIERCWSQEPSDRPTFDQILTEMRTNREYILENVNEKDYLNYIKCINEYKTTFDENKVLISSYNLNMYKLDFSEAIVKKGKEENKLIKIIEGFSTTEIHFPWKYFKELGEESKKIVNEAEAGDIEQQFKVGVSLIEGRHDFPMDTKIGVDFLKKSMKKGNKDSLIYYAKMLIKGINIPQNHKKVRKLLESSVSGDRATYWYIYGKLYKNERKYEEASESFKRSIEEGSTESLYEYGELLLKGLIKPEEKEEISYYMKEAMERGNLNATFKYGVYLKSSDEISKREEGDRLIQIAIDQGNVKALYYYGTELEKEEDNYDENKKNEKGGENIENEEENNDKKENEEGKEKGNDKKEENGTNKKIKEDEDESIEEEEEENERENNDKNENKEGKENINEEDEEGEEEEEEEEEEENNEDQYKEKESIKYFKKAAYEGHIKSLYKYSLKLLEIYEKWMSKSDNIELIRALKKASDKGFIKQMYEYGYIIVSGDIGIPANPKEGAKYVMRAAEMKNAEAMGCYANLLIDGKGVQADIEKAVQYYKMAIEQGSSLAMNDYAYILEYGRCVEANYEEAIKYYKMAIDKGCSDSMVNYATMLKNGKGCEVNYIDAIKYYKMAIDKGDTMSMFCYAGMLEDGEGVEVNYKEAIKYYKMAVDFGDIDSINSYARMFEKGKGVKVNLKKAIKYYKMGIDYGCGLAMYNYGRLLRDGIGVEKNIDESIKYIKMAIDHDSQTAMRNYAFMLENGFCVEQNYEEAIKYYKMAIEEEDSDSMYRYARMLASGKGVEVNYEESIKYYKMAIEKADLHFVCEFRNFVKLDKETFFDYKSAIENGDSEAMFNYAFMLEKGYVNEPNIEEAIKFYKISMENGNLDSKYHLIYLSLDGKYNEIDFQGAFEYCKQVINADYLQTLTDYANKLLKGKSIEINKEKVIELFNEAISENNTEAMIEYGQFLCKENRNEEGVELIKKAANEGNAKAMYQYGKMLNEGIFIERNQEEAIKYYEKASKKGQKDAINALININNH
ncbi:hypothetical protein M9Y10_012230 [Tritrichomonas musculus]|uniref:Protein kinase domain-containing protein n=1 Tax=Tritrichomonas musculus TaxID=1915356 RepID=A0ABR2IEF5_9EUKA